MIIRTFQGINVQEEVPGCWEFLAWSRSAVVPLRCLTRVTAVSIQGTEAAIEFVLSLASRST